MSDRPPDDGGSARSDAASRLAALLADVVDEPASPAPSSREPEADVPDPDATQPIPVAAPPPPPVDAAAAARQRVRDEGEEGVLAEARAFVRASAAAPVVLQKPPGRPWSRSVAPPPVAPPPPVVAPPPEPEVEEPEVAGPEVDGPEGDRAPEPTPAPVVAPAPPAPAPAPPPPAPERVALAKPRPEVEPEPDPGSGDRAPGPITHDEGAGDGPNGPRAPRVTVRAVAFGAVLALLMAAVPALGWVGSERLLDSRGGEVVKGGTDASEPGYRALVNPTPTALVVHRDATGYPVSATILSLGAGEAGGTVLLVPLTLQPIEGSYFHTIIAGYDSTRDDDGFRRAIEDVIGISVPPPIIDVTDESLATLVAPVAPLELTVTDPMVIEDGTTMQGAVSLSAEQVGPYLRATREGEPEIAHLERMRDVWVAWLAAIGDATGTEPIGAAATGMGTFLREPGRR